jgi:hypothetical protein
MNDYPKIPQNSGGGDGTPEELARWRAFEAAGGVWVKEIGIWFVDPGDGHQRTEAEAWQIARETAFDAVELQISEKVDAWEFTEINGHTFRAIPDAKPAAD